jgi:hypothetical protein
MYGGQTWLKNGGDVTEIVSDMCKSTSTSTLRTLSRISGPKHRVGVVLLCP